MCVTFLFGEEIGTFFYRGWRLAFNWTFFIPNHPYITAFLHIEMYFEKKAFHSWILCWRRSVIWCFFFVVEAVLEAFRRCFLNKRRKPPKYTKVEYTKMEFMRNNQDRNFLFFFSLSSLTLTVLFCTNLCSLGTKIYADNIYNVNLLRYLTRNGIIVDVFGLHKLEHHHYQLYLSIDWREEIDFWNLKNIYIFFRSFSNSHQQHCMTIVSHCIIFWILNWSLGEWMLCIYLPISSHDG